MTQTGSLSDDRTPTPTPVAAGDGANSLADTVSYSPRPGDADGSPLRMPAGHVGAVGSCDLLEEISRGGMGVVYRARQRTLGRTVALKVILDGSFSSAEQVRRFHVEAQAAANLKHPHIAAIYEFGEHEGRPYLVMEYVEGGSLAGFSKDRGPYDEGRVVRLMRSLALAVEYAHEQGVIHRDLKPSNVLIDGEDEPRIVDFGLAKVVGDDSSLTAKGVALGTPSYMAPEAAADSALVGPAADVYGLGAILYELLTGRAPFRANTLAGTLALVESHPPVPPRLLNAQASRDLEAVCLKCLEKSPTARYATAQAMAEDLDRILQGARVRARRRVGVLRLSRMLMTVAAVAGAVLGMAVCRHMVRTSFDLLLVGLGSAVGGAALTAGLVCVWNELALPAWLVTRTSHALAKISFGLGLVLGALVFQYPSTYLWSFSEHQVVDTSSFSSAFAVVVVVCHAALWVGVFGKLMCLAAAYCPAAQAPLLWSICADVASFVVQLNGGQLDEVGHRSWKGTASAWLSWIGALLFVRALQHMAAAIEEPGLAKRCGRLLTLMGGVCPAVFFAGVASRAMEIRLLTRALSNVYLVAWVISLVLFARLIRQVQERTLERV